MNKFWKENWAESRQHYLDWWDHKGLVISMWEHIEKDGPPHAPVAEVPPAKDLKQFWFDAEWRSAYLHYMVSRSSFKADMLPVANTHLGPGSLAAILGAEMDGREDTIWYRHLAEDSDDIVLDENNRWWQLHLDLVRMCKEHAQGHYFVGCPHLIEGMDTLDRPEELERQIQAVNDVWFEVFDRIYDIINIDGEMAFCYFSIWGPGKVAKLQSDISIMISPKDFRRFVAPYIRQQCQFLDYSMYHLDGVGAMRHVDALLEIEELDAIQWTPGVDQVQGGDPKWYDLYKRILAGGKSVMPSLVEVDELEPLLDAIGPAGVNVLVNFKTEQDVETAVQIASKFR